MDAKHHRIATSNTYIFFVKFLIFFLLGKHKKIKLAEQAELQSEQATSQPNVVAQNHRDVEANVTS